MSIEVSRKELGYFVDDEQIRSDYSGRSMYGKECLGIVFDDLRDFVMFVTELAYAVHEVELSYDDDHEHDLAAFYSVIDNVSTDGMGLSTIYYWPNVRVVE